MKNILLAVAVIFTILGAASAATLQGDHLQMCDQTLDISPNLRPSALLVITIKDYEAKRFGQIYESFAQQFENTLKDATPHAPSMDKFIANIRHAHDFIDNVFDVTPALDGKSEKLFESRPEEISFNCTQLAPHQVDMAAVALMTRWIRSQEELPELNIHAIFIAKQSKAHEALLNNGLPMWPWELWLNGKQLGHSDWEPLFKTQWILMRPIAGFEINTSNRASGNLQVSVGVEPIGFIKYQNDEYDSWWGMSLLATSSNQEGIGIGGLLRWNNYSLGITRHQSDTVGNPGSNFVFIGIEFHDFIAKKQEDFETWKNLQSKRLDSVLQGN